jgi:serine/threonine protein kinase
VLAEGSRLGSYDILSPVGAGGMGEVYKARATRLDRIVAIKVLPSHVAGAADLKARFDREARISPRSHTRISARFMMSATRMASTFWSWSFSKERHSPND